MQKSTNNNNVRVHVEGAGVMHINLADFPHGELTNTRKDDNYDIEFYSVPEGVTVPVYDEETSTLKYAPVSSWSIHKGKKVEIVNLFNGLQIFTDNDPRAVYGIPIDSTTLELERFTPTEALKRKVMVPVVDQSCKGSKRYSVDSNDERVLNPIEQSANTKKAYYNFEEDLIIDEKQYAATKNQICTELDFEFGQFLGCLVGDGWWDKADYPNFYRAVGGTRAVNIADNDGYNAAFVQNYLEKLLGCPVLVNKRQDKKSESNQRYGDTTKYVFSSKYMHVITKALSYLLGGERDEDTSGSGNKRLPAWAVAAPAQFVYGLLAGYLSTDGTINVTKASAKGGREQLQIAVTSTSIVLLQDLRSLLSSIGISSTISFSKITTAANTSWVLSLSSIDMKNNQFKFTGMCHIGKFSTLISTDVNTGEHLQRHLHIPLPACIADIAKQWLVCPKITKEMRADTTGKYDVIKKQSSFSISIYECIKNGYITLSKARELYKYAHDEYASRFAQSIALLLNLSELMSTANGPKVVYTQDTDTTIRTTLDLYIPVRVRQLDLELDANIRKIKRLMDKAKKVGTIKLDTLKAISSLCQLTVHKGMISYDLFNQWLTILQGGFLWSQVKSVDYTEQEEDGYDLTVPGYETFMSADGIILSNTINVHVPSSADSVKEAYDKLMPSKTPFSDRQMDKIVHLPKQEQILGLYESATAPATKPYVFQTEEEALASIKAGKTPLNADVDIINGIGMASKWENDTMHKNAASWKETE